MWKKLLIALIALTGTFTVGYAFYNTNLSAAANLNVLNEGDQVIVGTGDSGNEVVWKISKNNGSYYAMFFLWTGQVCSSATDNLGKAGSYTSGCRYYTTTPGKNHSGLYLYTKAFDDLYTASLAVNSFETAAVQPITESTGTLRHAYVPTISDITSGKVGFSVLPADFILSDLAYRKAARLWFNAYCIKSWSVAELYPSTSATSAYPSYINYHFQGGPSGWVSPSSTIFSYLNNADILYA